ncbi:probable cysteine--tRNA ligase, mitochondrial isoform X2 [Prorops nasuta]|uniref:probable cysteine--tRNA ligase, mitochondrial isoform X2 n=1 Tax=Prorops nasuta TaxID=863751 RepID=UPI0034CD49C2
MKIKLISRNFNIHRICKKFMSTQVDGKREIEWVKPLGKETNIKIYNSLTKCKVPLILRNENFLSWYMCGPTVYDSAHIGHAVTYSKFDIMRRILTEFFDINVLLVMGITDIDDKIIKRSNERGQDYLELTMFYENEFFNDMNKLNISKPYLSCRVSDYIPQIVQLIENILKKDGAYVIEDVDDSFHPLKKSALDFALWKSAKEGEPSWRSPWGYGRPGWHIECSAIASAMFGDCIDIHSGGIDLAFPHHENEEAQSCCYHEVDQWVNYWIHCGHLHLEGDIKMSKSLKNTISIPEFLEHYTANQFRLFCLLSNYRKGIEFSDELMKNSVAILHKIENFISDCDNYVIGKLPRGNVNGSALLNTLADTKHEVISALADDFDTYRAIQSVLNLVNVGNKMLNQNTTDTSSRPVTAVAAVSNYISKTMEKLGISSVIIENNSSMKVEDIIEDFVKFRGRVKARAMELNKDKTLLGACDDARSKLSLYHVQVKVSKQSFKKKLKILESLLINIIFSLFSGLQKWGVYLEL